MTDPELAVGDLTEDQLLARIIPLLGASGAGVLLGPGDDCAVVAAPDSRFVVTTDVLVEDRHFRRSWSTGRDVGRRAAAANLADVAAMGASPTTLVVSVVIPPELPVAWVEDLARGLGEACAACGATVVGGDLSAGRAVVVAATAHGDLAGRAPILRSGARPGDVVALAGRAGDSAAGLALLTAGRTDFGPAASLIAAYLRPEPPIRAGPAASRAGATAMMDVSDGLLRDAARMARASSATLALDSAALADDVDRLRAAADAVLRHDPGVVPAGRLGGRAQAADARATALRWVLTGGEDHGLLAVFPPDVVLPAPFRPIGTVRTVGEVGDAAPGVLVDGAAPIGPLGWDHFGGTP